MQPKQQHRPKHIGLAWLVGLLLLLPLAQSAASWHLLFAHSQQTAAWTSGNASGTRDHSATEHALHEGRCEICLTAAVVAAGALPALRSSAPTVALPDAVQPLAHPSPVLARTLRPYQSRAPPFRSS